jgi:redox-regulated HSP33 family molecular chaperone
MHLPDGVTVVRESEGPVEAVLAFVSTPAEVKAYAPQALKNLEEDGLLWLAYPKTRGKTSVELNRDRG